MTGDVSRRSARARCVCSKSHIVEDTLAPVADPTEGMGCFRLTLLVFYGGELAAQPPPFTNRERVRLYVRELTGPETLGRTAAVALLAQARDLPPDWPQGARGLGYRAGSYYGLVAVDSSIKLGAGALLGEDTRYKRMGEGSTARRLMHALISTVVWRTPEGSIRPALARTGALYGSSMIAMTWYPERYTAFGDGLRIANYRLAYSAGFNMFREYWPDIRRLFRK